MLNGIDLEGLENYSALISSQPEEAISRYGITAEWEGGVNSTIHTHDQQVGSKLVPKNFEFKVGEPDELLGDNSRPTPQDYLLGGLAGCMMVGFVAGATKRNINLNHVKLQIMGYLDLAGFLNVNEESPIGFPKLNFQFEVDGNGTSEQYDEIIESVQKFSSNYRTISDAVSITRL